MEPEIDINYCRFSIGQRIRASREHVGLSRAELAVEIGTNANTISNYENGSSSPNLERFFLMCRALQVSADMLLGIQYPGCGDEEYRELLRAQQEESPARRSARVAILKALHDFVSATDLPATGSR